MSNIPTELWVEILTRTGPVDLIQLRGVCSSWRNVIGCPMFRLQHCISSYFVSTQRLILSSRFGCYMLSFEKIAPSITPGNEPIRAKVVKIKNPITRGHEIRCLNHSNNGLVLLIDESMHKVIVWNPLTRRHQKLPVSDLINGFTEDMTYGIGFDDLSKECKVVLIRHHLDATRDVFVYKLRTNCDNCLTSSCWKKMEQLPKLHFGFHRKSDVGVFESGALHWIVNVDDDAANHWPFTKLVLLAIDLGTEKYRLMLFPQINKGNSDIVNLCVLGGCLCVTIHYYELRRVEAWVMKEYGVVESWSKLYVVTRRDLGVQSLGNVRPVAYSNCGSQVLLCLFDRLVWYHLMNKSARLIKLQGWRNVRSFTTTVYAGSLFHMDCDTLKLRKPPTMKRKRKSP